MNGKERALAIARAYLLEANSDHDSVQILLDHEKYHLAVYHAQQAVEKLMKALLAVKGKIGIYKHEIYPIFKEVYEKELAEQETSVLDDCVIHLEQEWVQSRYPNWESDPIWIPSQRYELEDARDSMDRMGRVFEILIPVLVKRYGVEP